MLFYVTPMYGNGWTDGTRTVNEPLPFDVEGVVELDGGVTGIVNNKDHELHGATFKASLRYGKQERIYNCVATSSADLILQGYCSIEW